MRFLFRKTMLPSVHHLRVSQNGEYLGKVLLRQPAEQKPLRYERCLLAPLPAQPVRVKHRRFFAPQKLSTGKCAAFSAIGEAVCFHAIEGEAVARLMRKAAARACSGAQSRAASAKETALANQCFRFAHASCPSCEVFVFQHGIHDLIEIAALTFVALAQHAVPVHSERFIKPDPGCVVRVNIQPEAIHVKRFKRIAHRALHRFPAIPFSFYVDGNAPKLKHIGCAPGRRFPQDAAPLFPAR